MNLRCWARRASDGLLCDGPVNHGARGHVKTYEDHYPDGHKYVCWSDGACASEAGPDGRETAALRILEVSHEIDRGAFLAGEHSALQSALRAVASRLFVNDVAAQFDLTCVTALIDGLERRVIVSPPITQVVALMTLATGILRPFASER